MSLYSVVVPVYNSEHTLGELYTRLEKVFRETLKEDFELILVDDGSKDRSYEIMTELREKDHRVRIMVRYANWERNFLYGQLQRCWEKIRIFRSPVTG